MSNKVSLSAATYGGNATRFAALEVSDFDQDIGVLNDDVEAIARGAV